MILRDGDEREIEFLLFQGEDSDFKDSIDQSVLTHYDDLFVDPTPEMLTEEQPPDYSFLPRFDVYPDDLLEIESNATVDDDSFDFEGEKIKEAKLLIDQLDLPCDILSDTTYSANSLLEEFADKLALISYPLDYDDNRACDIESDIREIEFLLFQGEDSDFKDSIDQSVLTNCDDLFVDLTPEMFTDEQPPDYSFPLRFDVDDVLPSPDNEDKVFNPGILSHEKSVKIITRFTQEKKLAVSFASWLFEDFDPPFYELLVFKSVPNFMRLLLFSSENEEKVFKPGIYTFKKVHCCFLTELSHPGFSVFKVN
nr:hypothetical protein [Tanacetum cinerariifolium]